MKLPCPGKELADKERNDILVLNECKYSDCIFGDKLLQTFLHSYNFCAKICLEKKTT